MAGARSSYNGKRGNLRQETHRRGPVHTWQKTMCESWSLRSVAECVPIPHASMIWLWHPPLRVWGWDCGYSQWDTVGRFWFWLVVGFLKESTLGFSYHVVRSTTWTRLHVGSANGAELEINAHAAWSQSSVWILWKMLVLSYFLARVCTQKIGHPWIWVCWVAGLSVLFHAFCTYL